MKKNTRINVILNARRDTAKVVENYRKLFVESDDLLLFYTHEEEAQLKAILSDKLGISEEDYSTKAFYSKFNEYDASKMDDGFDKRLVFLKMPNSLFHNESKALNDALKFVDSTGCARFVHFFADDYRFKSDAEYSPETCESYMDRFSEPFVMDGKTNKLNFAFSKMAPRFVFASSKLKEPVSFFQFEGHDHFVIDRDSCKLNFDEKVVKMHIVEYVLNCHKNGYVKNLTFYTDPVLSPVLERDESFPQHELSEEERIQVSKDSKYMSEQLKYGFSAESSVDPIIERMAKVLDEMEDTSETAAEDGGSQDA